MLAAPRSAVERRRLAHLSLAAAVSLVGLAAVVLYRLPPTVYGFYPVCPVRAYLHFECPGCGTTRALSALVHGRLGEALHWNALAVGIVLPLAGVYGGIAYTRAVRGGVFRWPQLPMPAIYAGVGVIVTFTLLRNLL